ncbi:major facilitator superfamily domain-containing protein [Echria macrotheca]|uniref:Major facilitator superfamily domain-containing protein n=1 Tax=Echria macrotheca TaxID=438768 RepID=A0AAJ0BCJ1_9PEZI|nr:major facilitator superfamily domain-containing protein [Echria macrotheca]
MADSSSAPPTRGTASSSEDLFKMRPFTADIEKQAANDSDFDAAATIVGTDGESIRQGDDKFERSEDEQPQDPNIVTWDGPNDPENPENWTDKKKWTSIAVLSIMTVVTPLGSSMFAPGIPKILAEFHETSSTTATFLLSIYILGFAFGPLFVAPMSEMYGRSLLYHAGNILFAIFSVGAALANSIGMLMAFRFLMGLAGSVPITIGSGSIADIMPVEKRGRAMAAWALGPLLGPCIGPIAGGYLIAAAGWRWVYWLIVIVGGVVTIVALLTLKETFAPVILERKAARLRKETGNPDLRSALADNSITVAERFKIAAVRPMKLLLTTPIITLMSLYVAVTYGILYLLFTTFSFVFAQVYNFDEGASGTTFLPAGIGMLIGVVGFGAASDRLVGRRTAAGLAHRPEVRIPPMFTVPAGLALPVGLFIYGWTVQNAVHWIVPMLGVVIFSCGLMGVMMCVQNYLLDAYPHYAASVTAALAVLRSLAGALLPLGGLDMYDALGLGWGNSLLGFIALGLVPIPLLFYAYGERLRKRFNPSV